jgi:hypothetical protein
MMRQRREPVKKVRDRFDGRAGEAGKRAIDSPGRET